jgi:hypothetical protein
MRLAFGKDSVPQHKSHTRFVAAVIVILAAGFGHCTAALGQPAAMSAAMEERILVVMSDGSSSVHKMTDQQVKIRTTVGETEVPLSKIVYIYRGKARVYSETGVISGEVHDTAIPLMSDDGATKQIPWSEMLFMSTVRNDLSGKVVTRLEVIVADGKVTKTVFQASADTKPNQQVGAINKPSNSPSEKGSPRITVLVLDEYRANRLFTLSNVSHSATLKKAVSTFPNVPALGPPFPVEFDLVTHQHRDYEPEVTIFVLSNEKGSGRRMEKTCRYMGRDSNPLAEGSKKRVRHDFGGCLGDLEGSGEVYVYVMEAALNEVYEKGPCKVELYSTVSNVLRLPVRFE